VAVWMNRTRSLEESGERLAMAIERSARGEHDGGRSKLHAREHTPGQQADHAAPRY
jgi:hypothetical protein